MYTPSKSGYLILIKKINHYFYDYLVLQFVSVMLQCFGLVMSLRRLLFLISSFSIFQFDHVSPVFENFSVTVAFFQYWFIAILLHKQSPGHPFLVKLSKHGHFCQKCFLLRLFCLLYFNFSSLLH